jgi:hypothetical protein
MCRPLVELEPYLEYALHSFSLSCGTVWLADDELNPRRNSGGESGEQQEAKA